MEPSPLMVEPEKLTGLKLRWERVEKNKVQNQKLKKQNKK